LKEAGEDPASFHISNRPGFLSSIIILIHSKRGPMRFSAPRLLCRGSSVLPHPSRLHLSTSLRACTASQSLPERNRLLCIPVP